MIRASPTLGLTRPPQARPLEKRRRFCHLPRRSLKGLALRVPEIRPYLDSLDANHDAILSRAELQPVIDTLYRTRVAALDSGTNDARTGGGRRARRGLAPVGGGTTLPANLSADFDGNGEVDDRETRIATALQRNIELLDGGRLSVILDRLLARWNLTLSQLLEVTAIMKDEKLRQTQALEKLDGETLAKLKPLIPDADWAAFQYTVIETPTPAPEREVSEDEQRSRAERITLQFDTNGDGSIDAAERESLVRALEVVGTGFGRVPPDPTSGSLTSAFVSRLLTNYAPPSTVGIPIADLPERMAPPSRGRQQP